jgi:hypothetical protein
MELCCLSSCKLILNAKQGHRGKQREARVFFAVVLRRREMRETRTLVAGMLRSTTALCDDKGFTQVSKVAPWGHKYRVAHRGYVFRSIHYNIRRGTFLHLLEMP